MSRRRVGPALAAVRQLVAEAEEGGSLVYLVRSLSVWGFLELSRGDMNAAHAALQRATEAAAALGIGEPGCSDASRTMSRRSWRSVSATKPSR